LKPAALTARQRSDTVARALIGKEEAPQEVDRCMLGYRPGFPDLLDQGSIQVQRLVLLSVVSDADAGTDRNRTRCWRFLSKDTAQEHAFPRAILANQADAFAPPNEEIQAQKHRRVIIDLVQIGDLEHFRRPTPSIELQAHALTLKDRFLDTIHVFEPHILQSLTAAGLVAVASQPFGGLLFARVGRKCALERGCVTVDLGEAHSDLKRPHSCLNGLEGPVCTKNDLPDGCAFREDGLLG